MFVTSSAEHGSTVTLTSAGSCGTETEFEIGTSKPAFNVDEYCPIINVASGNIIVLTPMTSNKLGAPVLTENFPNMTLADWQIPQDWQVWKPVESEQCKKRIQMKYKPTKILF